MRRTTFGFAATALWMGFAAHALAGTYDVVSCGDAGGSVNNAWTVSNDDQTYLMSSAVCPARSYPDGEYDGLRVSDTLATPAAPTGSQAEWRFSAPTGASITGWSYERWLGKQNDSDWTVYALADSDTPFDTCHYTFPITSCSVGSPGPRSGGRRTVSGLAAMSLSFGLRCDAPSGIDCATGGTQHHVWAVMYAATVTLQETTLPSVGVPTGALVTGSGWHRGTEDMSFTASDGIGIKETRVYVDGVELQSARVPRACDYTFAVPCTNPPGAVDHAVDTAELPDGEHQVEAAAIDAAGNLRRGTAVTVRVDNTAPSFGISAPAGDTTVTSLPVSWSSDDGDGSGVTGHDVEVSVNGGDWQPWLSDTQDRSASYSGTAGNGYRFRGRAADGSGLEGGWVSTAEAHIVSPPSEPCACPPPPGEDPPSQPPAPPSGTTTTAPAGGEDSQPTTRRTPPMRLGRSRRRGARLYVSGVVPRSARGRVTITYSARERGRTVRQRQTVRIRRGRFSTTLRLSRRLARARRVLLTVAYSGDDRFRKRTLRTRRIG